MKKGLAYLLVFFEPGPAYSREGLVYFGEGLACFEQGVWFTFREGLVYFSGKVGFTFEGLSPTFEKGFGSPFRFLPLAGPCALSGETGLVYFWGGSGLLFGKVWFTLGGLAYFLVYFGQGLVYFGGGLAHFEEAVWFTVWEGLVYFSSRSGLLLRVCGLRLSGVWPTLQWRSGLPFGLHLAGLAYSR